MLAFFIAIIIVSHQFASLICINIYNNFDFSPLIIKYEIIVMYFTGIRIWPQIYFKL